MPKQPKTSGLEWLEHSIVSFNGNGYADRSSAEAYLDSYIQYKEWKHKPDHAALAIKYYHSVLPLCEHLLPATYDTTHKPNAKNYQKFLEYKSQNKLL